jgi:hypothetical protein
MSQWTDDQIRYIEKCQERGNDAEVRCVVRLIVGRLEDAFERHVEEVAQFLSDMYATMVDPVEDHGLKVKELCELLLKRATEDRQKIYDLMEPRILNLQCPICDLKFAFHDQAQVDMLQRHFKTHAKE